MATFLATLFLIVCILMIIVILLQRGRGSGIGGAFGGAGQSAFGTRTGDVFTWVTIVLVGVFLLLAVGVTLVHHPPHDKPAPKPEFYPAEKNIDKPFPVTIRCKHAKAEIFYEIGSIEYTQDGPRDIPPADPTRGSHPYDAPVRIPQGSILKARAFVTGWEPSEVAVARYGDASKEGQARDSAEARAATTAPGR